MILSPTMQAGLKAVNELGGVKVNRQGRPVLTGHKHGVLVDTPTAKTLHALETRGMVELYEPVENHTSENYYHYRVTAAGRRVLDE